MYHITPVQCFARAFAPAFASTLFAFSVGFAFWPMRYFWVLVMVSIAVLGTAPSKKIVEGMHAKRIGHARLG
jgi:hypothetical protein